MPARRGAIGEAKAVRKTAAKPNATARSRKASASADRAKHQRASAMLRELRRDAEQLLANADRLLERLS